MRVAALLLFGALMTSCSGGDDGGLSEPLQPAADLLAEPEFVSDQWPSEDWGFDWTGSIKDTYEQMSLEFLPVDGVRSRWAKDEASGFLDQEVSSFSSYADAEDYFRDFDPRSLDEDFPLRLDASSSYSNPVSVADEANVYCLGQEGTRDQCGVWTYWARYGPYVLRLDYIAGLVFDEDTGVLGPGISLEKFLSYIKPFDDLLTDALTASEPEQASSTPPAGLGLVGRSV